ncbi:MAG: hypothetical protein IPM37_16910 [Hahellaceae bacterium]|nr:hypothetical protein [Hahellaceae bacterium]
MNDTPDASGEAAAAWEIGLTWGTVQVAVIKDVILGGTEGLCIPLPEPGLLFLPAT